MAQSVFKRLVQIRTTRVPSHLVWPKASCALMASNWLQRAHFEEFNSFNGIYLWIIGMNC